MKTIILTVALAALTGTTSLLSTVYSHDRLKHIAANHQVNAIVGLGASAASLYMALETVHNIQTLNRLFPKPFPRSTKGALYAASLSALGLGYFSYTRLSQEQKNRLNATLTLSDEQKNYLKTAVAHAKNAVISAANKPVAPYTAWMMPNL